MLTKFETKSNRVKGICFHPKRTWLLASLHSGTIQLWDFRMGTLVERFEGHDGPVRGVDFHSSQPLFCSGGDDYKIKVWNYQMHRCIFTLLGHLDYIRTVQFHPELPWIVSASDDQTIRVWNWQSRNCISVLTGHSHYVMCASFHPTDDMIVSASLDQTVRVWDISVLRQKSMSTHPDDLATDVLSSDIFGNSDAVVKYVLEGHDRGVNWASFHPTLPLVVSGADDKQIKLWRMNDTKAWEVDTMRGHLSNVSCVMFHPTQDLIVSNSEDKAIRVWDMNKRIPSQTFRRESDRFWVLAIHPTARLIAAGHDSGLVVFKLARERPAYCTLKGLLYYVNVTPSKERYLRKFEFATQADKQVCALRKGGQIPGSSSISYNTTENCLLMVTQDEQPSYELYSLGGDGRSSEPRRGAGCAAVWTRRDRFAVLEKNKALTTRNLDNEITKRHALPHGGSCDMMWLAYAGNVLLRCDDKIVLYDMQQMKAIAEITAAAKDCVWSANHDYVAIISKHVVVLCNKKLEHLATSQETMSVKSGVWTEEGVCVYSTLNHLKYALPNGDAGIICTLEQPVYLSCIIGESVFFLDREGKNQMMIINSTEYMFKMALLNRKLDEVKRVMNSGRLCGQAIIAYLKNKGFPEVALHFVSDEKTRFDLAVESGNIDIAVKSAQALDQQQCYQQLAMEALKHGKIEVVESAYIKTQSWERLSFLYMLTGNHVKLAKMLKHAKEKRGSMMSRYHNALLLGDVEERLDVLLSAKQPAMAYMHARTHGLSEAADQLAEQLGLEVIAKLDKYMVSKAKKLLVPPNPINRLVGEDVDWPTLNTSKGFFDAEEIPSNNYGVDPQDPFDLDGDVGGWADDPVGDLDDLGGDAGGMGDLGEMDEMGGDGGEGWDMGDLGDIDLSGIPTPKHSDLVGFYSPPTKGQTSQQLWSQKSNVIADQVAAGSFEVARNLLESQLGIVELAPLREVFLSITLGAFAAVPMGSPLPARMQGLHRKVEGREAAGMPSVCVTTESLSKEMKMGYALFNKGNFAGTKQAFLKVLHKIPFVVAQTRPMLNDVRKLLGICKEYVLAMCVQMSVQSTKKEEPGNATRYCELAAYVTHMNLEPPHLALVLRQAMRENYKAKNLVSAGSFARRLLELNPSPQITQEATKIAHVCNSAESDSLKMDYDERNPFTVCAGSMKPIYRGNPAVGCAFCGAQYFPQFDGGICTVCAIGKVGAKGVPGLSVSDGSQ
eukprot:TRINITY_DN469_c0_g1_i1.p1 TRINITY_DN469_c0_g1~~TRINITY_DN469_c0_g1_i1.p1  ORF type:complete len:1228 (-),score=236.64 TRINITY_DN469_c0_g1_i1:177-3860(-)